MKYAKYFKEQILRKRPYLQEKWFANAHEKAIEVKEQNDGRFQCWLYIKEFDKYLRVVYLEDKETIHNAFFDRNFKGCR